MTQEYKYSEDKIITISEQALNDMSNLLVAQCKEIKELKDELDYLRFIKALPIDFI